MSLAWELEDRATEIRSYDNLSQEYYYVGNIDKAKLYHDRVFGGKIEASNSMARISNKLSNMYNRKFKDPIVKTHQAGRKGLDAPDVGKKPNYGESRHYEGDTPVNPISGDPIERDRRDGKALAEKEESMDKQVTEQQKMSQTQRVGSSTYLTQKQRRAARKNYTLATNDERKALKDSYKVSNLKDKVSVVRKTDPNNLEPLFDDAQFREKVKRTLSQA